MEVGVCSLLSSESPAGGGVSGDLDKIPLTFGAAAAAVLAAAAAFFAFLEVGASLA